MLALAGGLITLQSRQPLTGEILFQRCQIFLLQPLHLALGPAVNKARDAVGLDVFIEQLH